MRGTTRKKHRKNSDFFEELKYYLLGLVVILIIVAVGWKSIQLQSADNSPFSTGQYTHIAVLVDITDKLSDVQKESIKVEIDALVEKLTGVTKFDIYSVSQDPSQLITPVISVQTSGRGDNNSEFTSNKSKMEKKWSREFKNPIVEHFANINDSIISKKSNIMEAIQAISLQSFAKSNSENKHFVIISDLLQNNENYSFYKSTKLDFLQFKKSSYFSKISTGKLHDVDTSILLIRRLANLNIQNTDFINFWVNFFAEQNSVVTEITSIDGA